MLQSTSRPVTDVENSNRCIIGDAILPQTGTKLTKTRGSKLGALVAPSDATEKNRNIGAQLQPILYTSAQKRFWKITSCRTFGAHKLVH